LAELKKPANRVGQNYQKVGHFKSAKMEKQRIARSKKQSFALNF